MKLKNCCEIQTKLQNVYGFCFMTAGIFPKSSLYSIPGHCILFQFMQAIVLFKNNYLAGETTNSDNPVYHLQMEPSTPLNDSNSRPIQYYQYDIPMTEHQPQQYQQINYQRAIVHQQDLVKNDHGYFQNQFTQATQMNQNNNSGKQNNLAPIHNVNERPMMLNAWSQTNLEDFPRLSCGRNNEVEKSLLAKIKDLETELKFQNEMILQFQEQQVQKNRTPSPRQDIPNSTTSTPVSTKPEGTRYRILAQADDEVTIDAQIQIELSDDTAPMSSLSSLNSSDNSDSDRLEICVSDENNPNNPERPDLEHATVSIGPNGTKIPVKIYENMSWASPSLATRKLLSMVFDRETLATHSMTGKASPAFKDQDKPIKGKLDPNAIQDIIFIVSRKCGVSPKEIRSAITTKCADENKMCKLKALKKLETSNATRTALKEILKNKTNRVNDNSWMK